MGRRGVGWQNKTPVDFASFSTATVDHVRLFVDGKEWDTINVRPIPVTKGDIISFPRDGIAVIMPHCPTCMVVPDVGTEEIEAAIASLCQIERDLSR